MPKIVPENVPPSLNKPFFFSDGTTSLRGMYALGERFPIHDKTLKPGFRLVASTLRRTRGQGLAPPLNLPRDKLEV